MQRGLQNKRLLSFQKKKQQTKTRGRKMNAMGMCAKVSILPEGDTALAQILKRKMRGLGVEKESKRVCGLQTATMQSPF